VKKRLALSRSSSIRLKISSLSEAEFSVRAGGISFRLQAKVKTQKLNHEQQVKGTNTYELFLMSNTSTTLDTAIGSNTLFVCHDSSICVGQVVVEKDRKCQR
jgi:hypothetical protein